MIKSRKNKISRRMNRKTRRMTGGKYHMGKGKAYCVGCKSINSMVGPKKSVTKNGKNILKGNCSNCGTKMNRFVKK